MLDIVGSDRVYPPELVMAMTTAFDNVCLSVSATVNGDPDVRRRLALIILRHVDLGFAIACESFPQARLSVAPGASWGWGN